MQTWTGCLIHENNEGKYAKIIVKAELIKTQQEM